MSTINFIPLSEINSNLDGSDFFICSASFESRSLSVVNSVDLRKFRHVFVATNNNHVYNHENLERVINLLASSECAFSTLFLSSDNPVVTVDALFTGLSSHGVNQSSSITIDITTFTRESLAILIRVIVELAGRHHTKITYLYNPAAHYGGEAPCWLSRGVKVVRSVIGYSGTIIPSRPNHLILLPGYEFERAFEVITRYEPNLLSVGTVPESASFSEDFYSRQRDFVDRLLRSYLTGVVRTFSFSARDSAETKFAILKVGASVNGCNTIVIPLNSKPSSIGACLACLDDPRLQMGYAQPEQYNTELYSTPSTDVLITKMIGF